MWRCDYCGQQQSADSRKCVDCGGPRAERFVFSSDDIKSGHFHDIDPLYWVDGVGYYSEQVYRESFAGKLEELNQYIHEARSIIGDALDPVFGEFHR